MFDTNGQPVEAGIFLIDKPAGPTSFRIVQQVRRALEIKKVGHAGTLDPFASGLLIVCAGRPATRIIPLLMEGEKEYEATIKLGQETDTLDLTGRVIAEKKVDFIDVEGVKNCLAGFVGEQMQSPPAYSALKHKGKPLYYYARKGIDIVKEPRCIKIRRLDCLEIVGDLIRVRVVCSKGTYIRSLAADIGRKLGYGAHLIGLRRVNSGVFSVKNAVIGSILEEPQAAKEALLNRLLIVEDILKDLTIE